MGKVEKGEGMTEMLKIELVMKNGRQGRSTQDQCLGERRVWKHGETHMQLFKEYDRKQ